MALITPLRTFLKDHMTSDSSDWTLTGMGRDVGKYKVEDDEYDHFLDLVHSHIFGSKPSALSLLEKHRENGPLLVDLDFKYAAGGPLLRRYNMDHVKAFLIQYISALIYFSEVETMTKPLRFYVMMKPSAESDTTNHKDGIHIQCPDMITNPKFQFAIRGFLMARNIVGNVFGSTGLINTPEDCYDVSVIHRNNWFLYGACKPNKAQYKVVQMYTIKPEDVNFCADFDDLAESVADILELEKPEIPDDTKDLIKLLSIRTNSHATNSPNIRSEVTKEWEDLLAVWGSGKAKVDRVLPSSPALVAQKQPEEAILNEEGRRINSEYSAEDISFAYRLARQCLNPERRAKRYEDWVNLAICLRNIADSDESFRVWVEVSRKVPGYETKIPDSEYLLKWNLLRGDGSKRLRLGSIRFWAKEDSPKTYMDICSETNIDWILNFAKNTHVNVASFVCRLYGDEFRCSYGSKRSPEWYKYDGHAWRHLRTANELRARFSNDVRNNYMKANNKLRNRLIETTAEAEKEILEKKQKNLLDIEQKLEMAPFKDNILKECAEKFYDEEFVSILNCNAYLVGLSNGVLELQSEDTGHKDGRPHVLFRPGRPEDNISFQMGRSEPDMEAIPYIPYDPSSQDQKDLMEFFKKIYPEDHVRKYVLTLLSSCLEGQNREQRFYVNQGRGSNGKSMVQTLMRYTFGDYQTSLQTTALTRKRPESSQANPDMIVTKCKRFIYMGEPDQNEKLNTARMKQLSGEDIVEARGLFADQEKFKMMGKIFLSCNDLPPVSSMDNGTWRRIRVIPHIATFKDPGLPCDPSLYEYPKDLHLDNKLKKWRVAFLSLLVHYYETEYLAHGLFEPECVLAASNKYKEENDVFFAFVSENYVKEPGAGPVRIGDVMDCYKEWKKTQYGKGEIKKTEMVTRLRDMCDRRSTEREFWGIRALEQDEDVSLV